MSSYDNFVLSRDLFGRPAELLYTALLISRGVPAFINPAPESDYEGRAAYDVGIGYPEAPTDLHDVKIDYEAHHTKNLFVELKSLLHTSASTFVYFVPMFKTMSIIPLRVQFLAECVDAVDKVNRGDGTFMVRRRYQMKGGGDQKESNPGILLPLVEAEKNSIPFWELVKQLKERYGYDYTRRW